MCASQMPAMNQLFLSRLEPSAWRATLRGYTLRGGWRWLEICTLTTSADSRFEFVAFKDGGDESTRARDLLRDRQAF
jgi:hypothetical protein